MAAEEGLQIDAPFSPGLGYGLVVGVGAIFAIGMCLTSQILAKYFSERQDSEMFTTAKHSVKSGLTASAVVSSWTIAATLLSSATYGYEFGVSGPYWYGAAVSIQILLFSVFAIELKRRAPSAHTFLEVARYRYGSGAHIVLGCYAMFYQFFAAVNLLVGGSTVYEVLTGANRDAICLLFPIGVVIYTVFGGIKATFITDWIHTVIIFIVMIASLFICYATSDIIGSPEVMWELLKEAAVRKPVEGNAGGEYLTMASVAGGYTGLVFIGGGFSAAVDSQLSQKAIASDPAGTLLGYILGGSCWFTIPFCLASTYGLAATAIEHLPVFPTYPNTMTSYEISTGMAMPYAALALWGKGGGIAVLLMIFMAVTSAMSSETIASSALVTHDVYQAYINPKASSKALVRVSRISVVGFSVIVAAVAIGFNHAGFSVNYLVTCIGIFVDSAIVPMACTVMWKKQPAYATIASPLICSAAGITAWLLTAYTHYGEVSLATTNQLKPLVAGNMMSLCGPVLVTPLLSLIKPDDYDWELLKDIKKNTDTSAGDATTDDHGSITPAENARLITARKRALMASVILTFCYLLLWPIPMYASNYVFSKGFFKGWIVVVFLWAFYGGGTITLLPIWQGRGTMLAVVNWCRGVRDTDTDVTEGVSVAQVSLDQVTIRSKAEGEGDREK